MKLSRTVSYAVRAAMQLAESEPMVPVPCSRLASEGEMPERFLLQILRILVTHGILKSTRGVDGGYSLSRPADEISLLEVIEAIREGMTPFLGRRPVLRVEMPQSTQASPERVTREEVHADTLKALYRQEPRLERAVEELDLELME